MDITGMEPSTGTHSASGHPPNPPGFIKALLCGQVHSCLPTPSHVQQGQVRLEMQSLVGQSKSTAASSPKSHFLFEIEQLINTLYICMSIFSPPKPRFLVVLPVLGNVHVKLQLILIGFW